MKRSGAATMPQCLATAPARIRNRISAPGARSVDRDLQHHLPRRLGERLAGAGLAPVAAVGRQRQRLGPIELAPDAAHQPEAVAADAPDARLVVVRRAEPAARGGDDDARDRRSSQHVSAVGVAAVRVADHGVLAGDVREAAEVHDVGEPVAGRSPAACRSRRGRRSRRQPRSAAPAPRAARGDARRPRRRGSRPRRSRPAFGAAGPGQPAEGEPAGGEARRAPTR